MKANSHASVFCGIRIYLIPLSYPFDDVMKKAQSTIYDAMMNCTLFHLNSDHSDVRIESDAKPGSKPFLLSNTVDDTLNRACIQCVYAYFRIDVRR